MKTKILMIGSLPPPLGGITVSFQILLDLLKHRDDVAIEIVDVNSIRKQAGYSLQGILTLCHAVIAKAMRVDVITVYCASTALPSLGLLLLVLARIVRKPIIIRKAAGFDYMDLGPIKGRISHFVIKHSDLYLAQTKKLVDLVQQRGVSKARWFPTSRPMDCQADSEMKKSGNCRRFVFVGQIRAYKGIYEILQASERFEKEISTDIYGPLFDDVQEDVFKKCKRVKYCGVIAPEKVITVLKQYDMLLMPTKSDTEGYPGVVFEGYSAGLPIITTRCGGIPEIVSDESGLFVEPGDPDGLFKAMQRIVEDNALFLRLKQGVIDKRKEFDSVLWADRFVNYCQEVNHKYLLKR